MGDQEIKPRRQSNSKVRSLSIAITMPKDLLELVNERAKIENKSRSFVISELVEAGLPQQKEG